MWGVKKSTSPMASARRACQRGAFLLLLLADGALRILPLVPGDGRTDCQSAEALRPWQRLQAACLCAPRGHPPTNRTRLGARYKTNVCELRFDSSRCTSAVKNCETGWISETGIPRATRASIVRSARCDGK